MTIIYDRRNDLAGEPQMHAIVVGCGRFPYIPENRKANRKAAYDSAIAVIDFLLEKAEALEPRLATIDCLLGDPDINPAIEDDVFPQRPQFNILQPIKVASPTESEFTSLMENFIEQFKEGDSIFFYCCSHGVAGRDETGLLVLEDIQRLYKYPWKQLLDVKTLAQQLPVQVKAKTAWIFVDACQEIIPGLHDKIGGVRGIDLFSVTAIDVARHRGSTTALCASKFGSQTFAPASGGVGYFTQALLDGITMSCVDKHNFVWKVSSAQLNSSLEAVAIAAGYSKIECTSLLTPGTRVYLANVEQPSIPVLITSLPETIVRLADQAKATGLNGQPVFTKSGNGAWHFRAPAKPQDYTIEITKDGKTSSFAMEVFPPAVILELK